MILDAFGILPLSELMLRLGIASLFGLVLGLDRELRGHEAGYRTHMLVALGAASMTVIGLELFLLLERIDPGSNADPLRIIEGVVAAIGFLGAGVIFQQRHTVRNVTTAANLWLCGAIGLACGAGLYLPAAVMFGFTIAILTGLSLIERALRRNLDSRD